MPETHEPTTPNCSIIYDFARLEGTLRAKASGLHRTMLEDLDRHQQLVADIGADAVEERAFAGFDAKDKVMMQIYLAEQGLPGNARGMLIAEEMKEVRWTDIQLRGVGMMVMKHTHAHLTGQPLECEPLTPIRDN